MGTPNADAVQAMIDDNPVLESAENGPLRVLALTLAGQMDAAEGEPSTRLSAAYLSVLKDLNKAARESATGGQTGGKLGQLRAVHGGQPPQGSTLARFRSVTDRGVR